MRPVCLPDDYPRGYFASWLVRLPVHRTKAPGVLIQNRGAKSDQILEVRSRPPYFVHVSSFNNHNIRTRYIYLSGRLSVYIYY